MEVLNLGTPRCLPHPMRVIEASSLKRRWRNGTTHVVFQPLELIEKLATLQHTTVIF
jgi:hypothetical protein